jgi:hypothetical protein
MCPTSFVTLHNRMTVAIERRPAVDGNHRIMMRWWAWYSRQA